MPWPHSTRRRGELHGPIRVRYLMRAQGFALKSGWTCDALESEEMNQNGQRAIANGNLKQWPDANPFGSRHQDCGWAARPEKRRVLEVSIGCSGLS